MPEKNRRDIDAQLKRIGDLLAERKKDDYESLLKRLLEARTQFHDLLAERFTDPFNTHLALQPQGTLPQKQELARSSNEDLARLGLAIRCPKSGSPARLRGDRGYDSDRGRFQLCLLGNSNFRRTYSSNELFRLELIGDSSFQRSKEGRPISWESRTAQQQPEGHQRK